MDGEAMFSRGDVMRRIQELEEGQHEIRNALTLQSSSIGSGRLQSGSFDGDLSQGDPGTAGWALGGDGVAAFASLHLREGIVDLEALVGRVETTTEHETAATFGVDASSIDFTATTPDWATGLSVIAIGSVTCSTPSDSIEFSGTITIEGDTSQAAQGSVDDSTLATKDAISLSHARTLAVSGGQVIDFEMTFGVSPVTETADWFAYLSAILVWSR